MMKPLVFLALTLLMPLAQAADPRDFQVLDPSAIDPTVNPCEDFYNYACGGWFARTELPSDKTRFGRGFTNLLDQNIEILHTVVQDYANGQLNPPVRYAEKLGAFYASCMDESTIEAGTPEAVRRQLAILDQLTSKAELARVVGHLHLSGIPVFFTLYPSADFRDSSLVIAHLLQGGLGLPDRSFYEPTDDEGRAKLGAYLEHIGNTMTLSGSAEVSPASIAAFDLEKNLASHSLPSEELHDPSQLYHPVGPADLAASTPAFNWALYFEALGIPMPSLINDSTPQFIVGMNQVIDTTPLESIKAYLAWQILKQMSPTLGRAYEDESFHFFGAILNGQRAQLPRWRRCVSATSDAMGEALGEAFVEKAFSAAAKEGVLEMIGNLRQALENDLHTLEWLDDATRAQALIKLSQMGQKIGYPDEWRNYDSLEVVRTSYADNTLAATRFETSRQLQQIGGPVNSNEWYMSPQTVNAYYDPSVNDINFPAAILLPPFFSTEANDASNYAAIGMVIGHEITHGFDTSGSQFDGHGVQRDWWTPEVKETFRQKAECIVDQYNRYEALPGLNLNGQLTLTENIADQGGVQLALKAYRLSRNGKGEEPSVADLTPEQQFFVSLGQTWCEKMTDGRLRVQVTTDPHSPAKFRVIGTVVNSPDFARVFSCAEGTPMAPTNRCSIW